MHAFKRCLQLYISLPDCPNWRKEILNHFFFGKDMDLNLNLRPSMLLDVKTAETEL